MPSNVPGQMFNFISSLPSPPLGCANPLVEGRGQMPFYPVAASHPDPSQPTFGAAGPVRELWPQQSPLFINAFSCPSNSLSFLQRGSMGKRKKDRKIAAGKVKGGERRWAGLLAFLLTFGRGLVRQSPASISFPFPPFHPFCCPFSPVRPPRTNEGSVSVDVLPTPCCHGGRRIPPTV